MLGFTSYQGTAGRLGTAAYMVQVPDKNGLETWIPASMAYGFLDFTPYNEQFNHPATLFLLKSPSHYTIPVRVALIPWNLVYDGLLLVTTARQNYALSGQDFQLLPTAVGLRHAP